jgi:hypothetical protein
LLLHVHVLSRGVHVHDQRRILIARESRGFARIF